MRSKLYCVKLLLVLATIGFIIAILMLSLPASIRAYADENMGFIGSDDGITYQQKEEEITYNPNDTINPSSGGAPCITMLVPGIGEDASAWSGSFVGGGYGYDMDSLPEQIRETYNDVKVYVAIFNETATSYKIVEQTKDNYNNNFIVANGLTKFSNDIVSYHSVVMLQFSNDQLPQSQAYSELELVVNSLLYEYKYWGAPNPTVNLIGHGRGGLLNIQYANEHPYTVHSLYNVGTPHSGSNVLPFLKLFIEESENTDDTFNKLIYSDAINELTNENNTIYEDLRNQWNNNTITSNPNLDAHFISGVTTASVFDRLNQLTGWLKSLSSQMSPTGDFSKTLSLLIEEKDVISMLLGNEQIRVLLNVCQKIEGSTCLYDAISLLTDAEVEAIVSYLQLIDDSNLNTKESILLALNKIKVINETYLEDETTIQSFPEYYETMVEGDIVGSNLVGFVDDYEELYKYLFETTKTIDRTSGVSVPVIVTNTADWMNAFIEEIQKGENPLSKLAQTIAGLNLSDLDSVKTIIPALTYVMNKISISGENYVLQALVELFFDKISTNSALLGQLEGHGSEINAVLGDIRSIRKYDFNSWAGEFPSHDYSIFMSDMVSSYDSQRGEGYLGIERFGKVFSATDVKIDKSSLSWFPLPITHFLETKDGEIIDYILENLEVGEPISLFTYKKERVATNEYGYIVTGLSSSYLNAESVEIPATHEGYNVIAIGSNAFEKVTSLTSIILPSTIKRIESFAFKECGIANITIPNSVESIHPSAFAGTNVAFTVDDFHNTYTALGGSLYSKDETQIIAPYISGGSFVIPDSVTTISQYAFYKKQFSNINLANVEVIEKYAFQYSEIGVIEGGAFITEIDATAFQGATILSQEESLFILGNTLFKYFEDSTQPLTQLEIPSNVSCIYSEAFRGTNIEEITINSNVSQIKDKAFVGMSNLRKVLFHSGQLTLGDKLFAESPNVSEIIFTSVYPPSTGGAFDNMSANAKICIPYSFKTSYENNEYYSLYSDNFYYKPIEISFDTQGGGTCESISNFLYYNSLDYLPTPTKEHYIFAGWYDLPVGGTKYVVGNLFDKLTDTTLYAQWTPRVYHVYYICEQGININPTTYTVETANLTLLDPIDINVGYTFLHWCYNGEILDSLPFPSLGECEIVAIFNANTYTVKLFEDYSAVEYTTEELTYHESFSLYVPTMVGYAFDGWEYYDATSGDYQKLTNSSGASFSFWNFVENDMCLYASWVIESYALIYENSNGVIKWFYHSETGPAFSSTEVFINYGTMINKSQLIELLRNEANAYKAGHKIVGVEIVGDFEYPESGSGGAQNAPGGLESYLMIPDLGENGASLDAFVSDSEMNTYAAINSRSVRKTFNFSVEYVIESYNIRINYFNGTNSAFTALYNESLSFPENTYVGHSFVSWMTVEGEELSNPWGVEDLTPGEEADLLEEEFVIYENFKKNVYTIHYFAIDGVTELASQDYEYNATINWPTAPTVAGYEFVNWSPYFAKMPAQNVSTTAIYDLITYTIKFKNGTTVLKTVEAHYNDPFPTPPEDPVKEGYTFIGWNEEVPSFVTGNHTITANFSRYEVNKNEISNGQIVIQKVGALDTAYLDCEVVFGSDYKTANVEIIVKNSVQALTIEGELSGIIVGSPVQYSNKTITIESGSTELALIVNNVKFSGIDGTDCIYSTRDLKIVSNEKTFSKGNTFISNGINMLQGAVTMANNKTLTVVGDQFINFVGSSNTGGVGGFAINATTINVYATNMRATGGNGAKGADGTAGADGTNGANRAKGGGDGGNGTNGSNGTAGEDGSDGGIPILACYVNVFSGAKLYLVGGAGGAGGAGGNGGKGGNGGRGGDGTIAKKVGNGGKGGNGGAGGAGGDGGDAGGADGTFVYIVLNGSVTNNGTIETTVGSGGAGGTGGTGGSGGAGGAGGTKWNGNGSGSAGANGSAGTPGANGSNGES